MEQRYTAEEHLRSHIKTLHDRFPNAQLYLIAHSHGGNVVVISQNFKRAILRQGSVKKSAVTSTRIKSQDNDGTTDGASRQQ